MEKITYGGWPNCIKLGNDEVELVATTDVGPRIIRFGFAGGSNLFKEWPEQLGQTGGEQWRIYGGHRLWHAPEARPRTYAPDNGRIESFWDGKSLLLAQAAEAGTGLQKEMEVSMAARGARVWVRHRLVNRGPWLIEVSPWALTVLQGPGRAILPQEPHQSHADQLLPVRPLVLWGYTDMQDPRYTWGTKFIQVRSDPERKSAQKIGVLNTPGWAAFARDGVVFLKHWPPRAAARYPDFGANNEVYTNGDMLELETLGPLTRLAPGAEIEHLENWSLHKVEPGEDEAAIEKALTPLLPRRAAGEPAER